MSNPKINLPCKLLGIICAAVLLLGSLYMPTALKASATPEEPEVITFENYPYDTTDRAKFGVYTLALKEGDAVGYDDNFVLNFLFDGDSTFDRNGVETKQSSRYNQIDHVARLGNVESGKAYAVTYFRKTNADTNSEYTITLCTGSPSSIWWSGFQKITSTVVSATSTESDWVKETVIFTPEITVEDANALYMLFNSKSNSDDAYIDVYVDNVTIQLADNYICFNENGVTNKTEYVFGNAGDAFNLPVMESGDNIFEGWYTDKECTVPFTATTIPAGVTNVYAKWKAGPITFKDYPYNHTERPYFGIYTMAIKEEANAGYNDDYVLNFLFDGDSTFDRGGVETKQSSRAGDVDHSATIGKVSNGSLYRISYYYKTNAATISDYTIKLTTATGNNIFANNKAYPSTLVTIPAKECDWTKVEFIFTPDITVNGANTLFIQFNSLDRTDDAYIDAYVDNVFVEELTGNIIHFHSNADGVSDNVISGEIGEPFTAPTVTNGKAEFLGWYLDEDLTVPFTVTTIPEGFTHVYAKWGATPMTFENYPYNTTNTGIFGATYKIKNADGIGIDDDYALQMFFKGDDVYRVNADGSITYIYNRANELTNVARIGTVKDGQVYRVSYYYKVNNSTSAVTVLPVTGNSGNIWDAAVQNKEYGSSSLVIPEGKNGEWTKATFYMTASVKTNGNTVGNALFLFYTVAGATKDTRIDILIDNLLVEEVNPPYVFFNGTKANVSEFVNGNVGDEIKLPANPKSFGNTFTGWFTDEECTVPFKEKTFTEGMAITVYAGWKAASKVTYNFENYTIPYKGETSANLRQDGYIKQTSKAYSGKNVLEFDRTGEFNKGSSYAAIAYNSEAFKVDPKAKYLVTVNYYLAKKPDAGFSLYITSGHKDNFWAYTVTSGVALIPASTKTGVWLNTTIAFDGSKITDPASDTMFIKVTGGDKGIIYIDDVTVTTIPTGSSAVVINNEGCKSIPTVLIGKPGASFASKLPTNPANGNMFFKGYYTMDAIGAYTSIEREAMKFQKELVTIYARFIDKEISQNFDDGDYIKAGEGGTVYGNYDFDYEVYDSEAEGNSKDNVTSGRYSLHRKGTSVHKENALLLTINNKIAEGERYTVSFKVKMGKHSHTDGAIKVVSCRSFNYAWTTTGDYYPVVSIADLADGQWHEVSYTFNSVEAFASIQTPGGVELFIDDVVFKLTPDAPLSTAVSYTEYVAGAKGQSDAVDVSTIVDISLYEQNGLSVWMIILIIAVAVVILGGAILIVIKTRKKAKT